MDNKGQGAVEYLLLIGGAVLIAAIVIVLLTSFGATGQNVAEQANAKIINAYDHLLGQLPGNDA